MTIDSVHATDSAAFINADYDILRSKTEEAFVQNYEQEEKYNLTALNDGPRLTDP